MRTARAADGAAGRSSRQEAGLSIIARTAACAAALLALSSAQEVSAQFNGDFEIRRAALSDENFLDWKAYQFPVLWRYDWYTTRNGLRASVGSLNDRRFYMLHDIKLQADLGRSVAFLYTQESESFTREDGIYQEAEMRFGEFTHASLLGWPQHEKRLDNIGAALGYGGREKPDFMRVSYLRQFAEYNARSTRAESAQGRYVEAPQLYRLEARRLWGGRLFTALEAKWEAPVEFEQRETGVTRDYEGDEVTAEVDWWGPEGDWLVGGSLWRDAERREQAALGSDSSVSNLEQRMVWYSGEIYSWMRLADGSRLTIGFADSGFSNRIRGDTGADRFQFDITTAQLYSQWELHTGEGWYWLFSAQGAWVDLRRIDGTDSENNADRERFQAKGGVGLALEASGSHRFLFFSSWDLDSFEKGPWDGGGVQMQIDPFCIDAYVSSARPPESVVLPIVVSL